MPCKCLQKSKWSNKGRIQNKIIPDKPEKEVKVEWSEDNLLKAWKWGVNLPEVPKLFIAAGYTYFQTFAKDEKIVTNVKDNVPREYHKYLSVFSEEASKWLSESKAYDHAIELIPSAKTFHLKVYSLSEDKQEELDKFLKEKGYIQESKSPISSLFFFIQKKYESPTSNTGLPPT